MQTQTERQTERQAYRQAERQTDRETNTQTEKQRIREKGKFPGVTTPKTWQVNFYYHIQFEEHASCSFSAQ